MTREAAIADLRENWPEDESVQLRATSPRPPLLLRGSRDRAGGCGGDCGNDSACRYWEGCGDMSVVWVLWHMYGDGSGAHIERVYVDEIRAKQDYALLTDGMGKAPASEWKLDKAQFIASAYK